MNRFQLLFVLTTFENRLIIGLELRVLILFLLLFLHHLLVLACPINVQVFFYHFSLLYLSNFDFQTSNQNYMFQELNYHDLIWASCYFFQNQVIHCIHQNRFLENYYIIAKLDHIHLFRFFFFLCFELNKFI